MASATPLPLTAKDLASDQEVRWCPGCGDFSVLAVMKQVLASLGVPRERFVFVSGVGCSSRLPYYLNTYGFQTLHGRAPTVATGLKLIRPELSVWVVTGDGDGLSIGGNHLIHALRRNVDLKILLFNNEVLGLTQGQYSPTSRAGTRTRANPQGSIDEPLRPLTLAVAAGATFVARTIDVDVTHLTETLRRAAAHKGSAFVEIYQNCKVFNDGVFEYATEKGVKADNLVYLEHGKPLVFGQDQNRGIRLRGLHPEAVTLTNGTTARRPPGTRRARPRHDAGAPAEPDGLSESAGVRRRAALRGAADLRRLARRRKSTRPSGRKAPANSTSCSPATTPGMSSSKSKVFPTDYHDLSRLFPRQPAGRRAVRPLPAGPDAARPADGPRSRRTQPAGRPRGRAEAAAGGDAAADGDGRRGHPHDAGEQRRGAADRGRGGPIAGHFQRARPADQGGRPTPITPAGRCARL